MNTDIENDSNEDIFLFWESVKVNLPYLSAFIKDVSKVIVSNAFVERSFSNYRKILTKDRLSLTDHNIEVLNLLYSNKSFMMDENKKK